MQGFPLAWRWAQPSQSVLPSEVRADIPPLSPLKAAGVWAESKPPGSAMASCFTSDPSSDDVIVAPIANARFTSLNFVILKTWMEGRLSRNDSVGN